MFSFSKQKPNCFPCRPIQPPSASVLITLVNAFLYGVEWRDWSDGSRGIPGLPGCLLVLSWVPKKRRQTRWHDWFAGRGGPSMIGQERGGAVVEDWRKEEGGGKHGLEKSKKKQIIIIIKIKINGKLINVNIAYLIFMVYNWWKTWH